jgi:hypothetical protein
MTAKWVKWVKEVRDGQVGSRGVKEGTRKIAGTTSGRIEG